MFITRSIIPAEGWHAEYPVTAFSGDGTEVSTGKAALVRVAVWGLHCRNDNTGFSIVRGYVDYEGDLVSAEDLSWDPATADLARGDGRSLSRYAHEADLVVGSRLRFREYQERRADAL